MNWQTYYKRWADRAGSTGQLDGGVTFVLEKWEVPGEAPLLVRACTRAGHPQSSFAKMVDTPKHSITLHHTSGYGNFGTLMGDSKGSAHFMVGRDGNAYRLVDTEKIAWHANLWSLNSVGIEVDNPGHLRLKESTFYDEYGTAYCTKDDEGVWVKKHWPNYGDYWAAWSEEQYAVLGRLLKALCARHGIPRMILPEDRRYKPFDERQKARFRGICVHVNVNPHNRDDLGPYVDWARLIRYGGLTQGDCFGLERSTPEKRPSEEKPLLEPELVDARTVRVSVGERAGRISLTIKAIGEELKPAPKGKQPEAPKDAEGRRDKFIAAALSYEGTPYRAGSEDPAKGLDAAGLIALCLKKVGVKLEHDPDIPLDGPALAAHFAPLGGDADQPPAQILPGDLAWFGEGDHDHPPTQHPMIWLGGGKVLGPEPGVRHEFHGAVQVMAIADVGEKFAGFSHIEELGKKVSEGDPHHGAEPPSGHALTAALLPADPDALYQALQGVVKDAGGKWVSEAGKVNLVGVTDLADRCHISPLPRGWNDTLFAAWVDAAGHKHVIDARASLNPGHDSDPADSWHLLEGAYTFKLENDALVPDGKVRGWHDEKGAGALRSTEGPPPPSEGDIRCDPPLRGLAQYDGRLDHFPVQGEKKSWKDNACHPTSVAMIFRWIAQDNPATRDRFAFPTKEGSKIPKDHYHRRLMEAFWPDHGGQMPLPADGKIAHKELREKACEALGMKGSPMLPLREKETAVEKRLPILRKALAKGPVVLLIPDHYVVLQGFVGDEMLIVDPGDVLAGHWLLEDGSHIQYSDGKQYCGMPDPSAWPKGEPFGYDQRPKIYVRVPIHKKVKRRQYTHHSARGPDPLISLLDGAESYYLAGSD